MNEEKSKMLKLTTDQIETKFGKGSIMKFGEGGHDLNIGVIPTGALPLDAALGIGGVPRGRIVEVYGPESSGKTTLALQIIAEAQAMGGIVAFIDAEHALDPVYAARLGVDIDEVLISQPDTGEQALEICDMLVRSGAIDVIVIDEVYALYNNKNKTKLYQSDFDFGSDKYAVGFRKGDKELAVKVNDAIQECIDDGTADKICEKWFGKGSSLIINEGYDN